MHTCIYTRLVTYNIELHHFRIGDDINIKGDKQARIIELELLSILFENLYTEFRRGSANVGILIDTNILLALYGLEMQGRRRKTLLYLVDNFFMLIFVELNHI